MSEQCSLHSMRSNFSPSTRLTGSAPASRRDIVGAVSSNFFKPSAHSVARPIGGGTSAAYSLLSAFGHGQSQTSSWGGGHQQSPLSPIIGSQPLVHMSPSKSNTVRSIGSAGSTTVVDTSFGTMDTMGPGDHGGLGLKTERSMSPLSSSLSMTSAPWVGGDRDFQPAA